MDPQPLPQGPCLHPVIQADHHPAAKGSCTNPSCASRETTLLKRCPGEAQGPGTALACCKHSWEGEWSLQLLVEGRSLPISSLCHLCSQPWLIWTTESQAKVPAQHLCTRLDLGEQGRAVPAHKGTSPCAPARAHAHAPRSGPARTDSSFLPAAAAAGGISDLLMKRSACAAGACQAEMSARGDWITPWPVSLTAFKQPRLPAPPSPFPLPARSWGRGLLPTGGQGCPHQAQRGRTVRWELPRAGRVCLRE